MHADNISGSTQEIFRILMQSMAHPGRVYSLPGQNEYSENNFDYFSGLFSSLLDHEVKFGIIGAKTSDKLMEYIYMLTRAEHVTPDKADYVIISGGSSDGRITEVSTGTADYPDRGSTLIYFADEIGSDDGIKMTLSGPGIKDRQTCSVSGVDRKDMEIVKSMNSEFPLGVDIIFIDVKNRITSIPRSSKIMLER
jgi:alpha-D-ribose 1-methylphosphonate 5-triphosphate synthase subunit PhnH